MNSSKKQIFLICGLLLTLAASSVFAQKEESVKEIEVNKKPLTDFSQMLSEKINNKQVDLDKPFLVELRGILTDDGKLDTRKSRFTRSEGDAPMINIAKFAIEAVSNSGFFGYFKNLGINEMNLTVVQDDKQVRIIIFSDQKTSEKAKTTTTGFNTMLMAIKFADKLDVKKLDENSRILVNNLTATSEETNTILKFVLPKEDAQNLIKRNLDIR